MNTPAQRAADRMAADAREKARREHEALALAARVAAVPVLDAQTANFACGFLHWLQIALQRVHDVKRDPFWCLADVQDAAESSARYLECIGFHYFEVCK